MNTLRTLVAILTIVAVAGTFTGSVMAAEATGRQPAMTTATKKAVGKAEAATKKVGKEGSKTVTKAKAGASRMAAESTAKKAKGDKPLKAGKNAGGRKKAA